MKNYIGFLFLTIITNLQGQAIWGESIHEIGVTGSSTTSFGVYGFSSFDLGVGGTSEYSVGVEGTSLNVNSYDVNATGPGINYGATSSKRWKTNIVEIQSPLTKIAQLRGVYFDWDEAHGGHHDIGFIAEEVGKVLPEIVGYEENGVDASGMDYSKLTPLLVEAMNEMRREYQEKFDKMESQIRDQQEEIRELQSDLAHTGKKINKKSTTTQNKQKHVSPLVSIKR